MRSYSPILASTATVLGCLIVSPTVADAQTLPVQILVPDGSTTKLPSQVAATNTAVAPRPRHGVPSPLYPQAVPVSPRYTFGPGHHWPYQFHGHSTGLPYRSPLPNDPPTPSVSIQVRVKACSQPGKKLQYLILVRNQTAVPAHHVVVRNPLPINARFVSARPLPDKAKHDLLWLLGTLPAYASRKIELVLLPVDDKVVKNCARVGFEHGQVVLTNISRTVPHSVKPPRVTTPQPTPLGVPQQPYPSGYPYPYPGSQQIPQGTPAVPYEGSPTPSYPTPVLPTPTAPSLTTPLPNNLDSQEPPMQLPMPSEKPPAPGMPPSETPTPISPHEALPIPSPPTMYNPYSYGGFSPTYADGQYYSPIWN